METDEGPLAQLAAAVLDGTPVDWTAARRRAHGKTLPLINHLETVATLSAVHRGETADHWGHLQLIERIGAGTFGEVYRAWDPRLDREVALKLLPADAPAGRGVASPFIHEGRLLARVRHPNVVTIHGAEQIGDRIGLWMELVRGRTLEQVLEQGTTFTPAEAARIGRDLCQAVAAVHAAGLLHRDIKAHNVMLADDGRIVLMDFGTGRELDDPSSSDLTGTPLYAAPEVLEGGPATAQSDVYGLGVLIFHLLTRSYPIKGRTVGEIQAAHGARVRTSLRASRPDVPFKLARAIEHAIDPRPDRRFPTAAAFGAALQEANGWSGRWRRFAAVAAIGLVVPTIFLWREPSRPPAPAEPLSIAVLPFAHQGAGSDGTELADGLTAEIQRNLAAIDGLAPRSVASSFALRNQAPNLAAFGSQLGVDYLVEGSVERSSRRIHITARLARAAGNLTLWAGTFDRGVADLDEVLDEISLAIVNELRLTLGRGRRRYDLDPDAYYQFLRARAFHGRRGPDSSAKAAALFQQVVDRHPDYAPAWAGLASALAQLSRPSLAEEMIPPDPRLGPAALKAIQLDPLLPEAHAALGNLYARDRDWVNARMSFLKAIDLDPSLTSTHTDFVLGVLLPIHDLDEALRQLDAARAVDPLSLDVRRVQAHVLVEAGEYEHAIEVCRWIQQHDPTFPFVDVWLGRALMFLGRFDEAQQAFERGGPQNWGYVGYMLAARGRRAEAEALAAEHPDEPGRLMLIYGGLGDKDRAFAAIEQSAKVHWWHAATWMQRPEMAVLRGDPRFAALKKRFGLPD